MSEASNTGNTIAQNDQPNYTLPLAAMTTLFFLWGFITVLNDVLIPHLKASFSLNYTEAMLIQFCFFGAYFLMSVPSGYLVRKIGYKNGIITGLTTAGIGCILFYPAATIHQYWIFLSALFVLASGITLLQVAANPYVAALGDARTATSRLNFAQALNSLGTTLGPIFGHAMFFGAAATAAYQAGANDAESVRIPYLMVAGALLTIAVMFAFIKLPKIHEPAQVQSVTPKHSIFEAKHTVMGAVAIFFYVGGEVAIGSFLINYLAEPNVGALSIKDASAFLSWYWGGAMVGRFIGAAATRYIAPFKALAFNGAMVVTLLVITMNSSGALAMYSVLAIGLFNSIMFPTIFTLAIADLEEQTSYGSGMLCLAIVGGALVPVLQGLLADKLHIQISFIIPALCYLVIIAFALLSPKLHAQWLALKQSDNA